MSLDTEVVAYWQPEGIMKLRSAGRNPRWFNDARILSVHPVKNDRVRPGVLASTLKPEAVRLVLLQFLPGKLPGGGEGIHVLSVSGIHWFRARDDKGFVGRGSLVMSDTDVYDADTWQRTYDDRMIYPSKSEPWLEGTDAKD